MYHYKMLNLSVFCLPDVFMGQQQLRSARTHGVTHHVPSPCKGRGLLFHTQIKLHHLVIESFIPFLVQLSEGIRVWDASAGMKHTLLLADGDCIQPIIYYSGQQVKDGEEEEGEAREVSQQEEGDEEQERARGFTPQPVLLPFCMNVSINFIFFF